VKPEIIKWWDHSSYEYSMWRHREKVKELTPLVVTSVGFIVKEKKKYLVIVPCISDGNMMQDGHCIIKGCIKSRKKLK
tara:strand:- start:7643 stop:7876 length:234 start_codon:yes stop_codon:yes gene_type:complete